MVSWGGLVGWLGTLHGGCLHSDFLCFCLLVFVVLVDLGERGRCFLRWWLACFLLCLCAAGSVCAGVFCVTNLMVFRGL